jgi:hypothetical protein
MIARTPLLLLLPLLAACSTHQANVTQSEVHPRIGSVSPETTWYYLDGEQIQRADVLLIDRAVVMSVSHFIGAAASERHGANARDVVEIITKREAADLVPNRNSSSGPLYLLDGRQITKGLVAVLDPAKISSVEVLKGTGALVYGELARDGVILIASKAR